jgi:hypothetical protein
MQCICYVAGIIAATYRYDHASNVFYTAVTPAPAAEVVELLLRNAIAIRSCWYCCCCCFNCVMLLSRLLLLLLTA